MALDLVKLGWDQTYIASCRDFEWKYSEPANTVLPTASKTPRRINEPADVHGKGTIDWVQDG
jgi:hypothetical protein